VALAGWLHTEISVWHQELNFFTVLHFLAFVFAPLHLYKFTITRVAYSSLSRVSLVGMSAYSVRTLGDKLMIIHIEVYLT